MNTNPIPHSTLFDTPTSAQDLIDWCLLHSGGERTAAVTAAMMALNLSHYLVDEQLKQAV
jgi:hypothetical protein